MCSCGELLCVTILPRCMNNVTCILCSLFYGIFDPHCFLRGVSLTFVALTVFLFALVPISALFVFIYLFIFPPLVCFSFTVALNKSVVLVCWCSLLHYCILATSSAA